jgi:hypothetical protein
MMPQTSDHSLMKQMETSQTDRIHVDQRNTSPLECSPPAVEEPFAHTGSVDSRTNNDGNPQDQSHRSPIASRETDGNGHSTASYTSPHAQGVPESTGLVANHAHTTHHSVSGGTQSEEAAQGSERPRGGSPYGAPVADQRHGRTA